MNNDRRVVPAGPCAGLTHEQVHGELKKQADDFIAAERSKLELIDELRHQLDVVKLELQRSEKLRELAEHDALGIRVTQKAQKDELREHYAQIKNLKVMYNASEARVNDLINERDSYQTALSAIRAETSASFDSSLKRAVQHIVKGLEL